MALAKTKYLEESDVRREVFSTSPRLDKSSGGFGKEKSRKENRDLGGLWIPGDSGAESTGMKTTLSLPSKNLQTSRKDTFNK